jgi:hypothetical protein
MMTLWLQNVRYHRGIVDEIHTWYDSLQYPILFPNAEDGYCIYLRQVDPLTCLPLPTNPTVSSMNFYTYRITVRDMNFNRILKATILFHQFLVDMYAKIETERPNFIKRNQRKLSAENYIHLKDSVDREGAQREDRDVGQVVILPSSFTGGPRYMHERTQDAMIYVRKRGRPDLFVSWEEIQAELCEGQKSYQRHDFLAIVFHLKFKKLMDVMTKGEVFGATICHMYY